jgi:hypothetical protein
MECPELKPCAMSFVARTCNEKPGLKFNEAKKLKARKIKILFTGKRIYDLKNKVRVVKRIIISPAPPYQCFQVTIPTVDFLFHNQSF